ncbi:MAG: hypothetical protein V4651_01170 [Bacteroidota bacterium]
MRIFYDTEFLEGTQTKRILGIPVGKTKPTIDLISIGMVNEKGDHYYAVSKDFNLREAWERYDEHTAYGDFDPIRVYWIRENVLRPVYDRLIERDSIEYEHNPHLANNPEMVNTFSYSALELLIDSYGKTNNEIGKEVHNFCMRNKIEPAQLYGYYSAYDHVALCWLFGKMINLPAGMPMYTIDLKQILDEKEKAYVLAKYEEHMGYKENSQAEEIWVKENRADRHRLKNHPNFPKQDKEHDALADAAWNKQLYEFLKSLSV